MQVKTDLSICADCLMWHANGDTSGIDSPERERDVRRADGIDRGDVRHVVALGDDLGFCRSACDACGETLHGDRFSAAVLG